LHKIPAVNSLEIARVDTGMFLGYGFVKLCTCIKVTSNQLGENEEVSLLNERKSLGTTPATLEQKLGQQLSERHYDRCAPEEITNKVKLTIQTDFLHKNGLKGRLRWYRHV